MAYSTGSLSESGNDGHRFGPIPHRKEPNHSNGWDDGGGLYFDDPNGHLLEIITCPYGCGGAAVSKPYSLVTHFPDTCAISVRRVPFRLMDASDNIGNGHLGKPPAT